MRIESPIILLVEDDDGHASLVRRNLRRSGIAGQVVRVADGQEALDYLSCTSAYADRPPVNPSLVVLDIKMPRLDGTEVLRRLKADPATASIPVAVLTTTDDPGEMRRFYALGCDLCVVKPVTHGEFMEAVTRLGALLSTGEPASPQESSLAPSARQANPENDREGKSA